jgi:lipopolysaccharide transport system permease protein
MSELTEVAVEASRGARTALPAGGTLDADNQTRPYVLRIEASHGAPALSAFAGELWRHRELIAFLAWRELKVRYKETALGLLWAVAQPVLTAAVFSLIFSRVHAVSDGRVPYLLFTLAGLVPWLFFGTTVTTSSTSFITSQSLVTKIYFPRAAVPIATVLAATVDLLVGLVVVGATMAWFHVVPGPMVLLVPIAVSMLLASTLGAATLVGIMTVRFRDLRYVVPFAVQIGMFITPVFYPVSMLHSSWAPLIFVNPVASSLELLRAALFNGPMPWTALALGALSSGGLLVTGFVCACSLDRKLPDLL